MKNKGLIITLVVVLLMLIIGLIVFLCLSLNGNFKFRNWSTKKSSQVIFDENYEVEEINDLEIQSTTGDIKFLESTDGNIRVVVYGKNAQDLKVTMNEAKLMVDYSEHNNNSLFGFNFYINDILIYIPKDYAKDIHVNTDYGDMEAIDLENATMSIEADCGDVTLGKVKNVTVNNDYGDVEIESILNKASIEVSCGDVKINSVTIRENSCIKNNFGDVKIGQTNEIFIDAETDLGDVKVNQNNRQSEIVLKIENDCGDIKVEN